jgi:uncharacterized protein (TIGR03067 family)
MRFKFIAAVTVVLSFSLLARSGDSKDGLDGTWLPVTAELAGKVQDDVFLTHHRIEVNGDKFTRTTGRAADHGTVKLNPTAKPKQLDITATDGSSKGKTILAIYERDGDTLRICYDFSGEGRPAAFKTKEGTRLFLVTYKRKQP